MTFAVVIVTYNRLELLKECIQNVEGQSIGINHIVIVDNNSTDGTKEYLSLFNQNAKYRIILLNDNKGGAYGFYEGIKSAIALLDDWILLIDDDAIIEKDYLFNISKYIDEKTCLAYSGAVKTNGEIYTRHRTRLKYKKCYQLSSVPIKEYAANYFWCDSATFCGLLFNRKIVDLVGLPNKDYFIWEDDAEYCLRFKNYTLIKNINSAVLNHKTNAKFDVFSWKSYYGARNSLDIAKKYYGLFGIGYCMLHIEGRILLYILKEVRHFRCKQIVRVFCLYKDAIKDGLMGKLGKNYKYLPK